MVQKSVLIDSPTPPSGNPIHVLLMKAQSSPFLRAASSLSATLAFCLSAQAGTYYWDTDGSGTPGFGTAGGTWGTGAFWGTDPAGSGATANTTITTADDINFGTDSSGLAGGTITGPATAQGFLNMTFGAASGAIALSGGTLNLDTTTGSTDHGQQCLRLDLHGLAWHWRQTHKSWLRHAHIHRREPIHR